MVCKFEYTKFATVDSARPWIARSMVPIRLFAKSRFAQVLALVDSGADYSLFHTDYAEALVLTTDIGDHAKIRGIAGKDIIAQFHTVELQVIGFPERIKTRVGFTESPGVDAILGQTDFFMRYNIKFERSKGQFEIRTAKI